LLKSESASNVETEAKASEKAKSESASTNQTIT